MTDQGGVTAGKTAEISEACLGYVQRYEEWCKENGQEAWPADWQALGFFITSMAQSMTTNPLRVLIAALGYEAKNRGYQDAFEENETLRRIVRGVMRTYAPPTDGDEPLTVEMLEKMDGQWETGSEEEQRVILGAWTGVYTLAMPDELFSRTPTRPTRSVVRTKDLRRKAWGVHFPIFVAPGPPSQTKAQVKVKWIPIPFMPQKSGKCVAQRLVALQKRRIEESGRNSVLFATPDGKPITVETFVSKMQQVYELVGLDSTTFGEPSLRRGGAESLWQRGASYQDIRVIGRWKRTGVHLYTQLTATERRRLVASLGQVVELPGAERDGREIEFSGICEGEDSVDALRAKVNVWATEELNWDCHRKKKLTRKEGTKRVRRVLPEFLGGTLRPGPHQ